MERKWWKEGVVYQVYPRSFNDSNGDGIGDLRGITEKLDYLKDLGVDILWLSPVYESPNDDNGYDISNYRAIMDEFGTMEDWETMLEEIHKRDMRLVMDLVVNHTSDEHEWFQEARKSKDNPYRDYYIWRDGKDGAEPNNWVSFFSGSAWDYDEETAQYYLHLFTRKQPDLNWENEQVRKEVFDMMKFWLDKGIDGFRMDVINLISKTPGLPDALVTQAKNLYQWGGEHFVNGPRFMEFMNEMNDEVLQHYDVMTVGETAMVKPEDGVEFTNEEDGVLSMVFQFDHMEIDGLPGSQEGKWSVQPWKLSKMKEIMSDWQHTLNGKGWNSLYLENHDQPRSVSRFGNDKEYHKESAKMLATWYQLMQGTPYIYQGQEIGMTNVKYDSIEDYRDVEIHNWYNEQVTEKGKNKQEIMHSIFVKGRDNARTPMQWSGEKNAGFTPDEPWIKVNPNYTSINVEDQQKDEGSILNYYKELIRLRKNHDVLLYGSYKLLDPEDEQVYAYERELDGEVALIVANFTKEAVEYQVDSSFELKTAQQVIGNYPNEEENGEQLHLKPYEARVYIKTTK
ncbi:oligo-1,6-glucosidase [Pontibacillus halophilus JSM 076056 = DSM 19796]|uniref:oligo-1,6-glucosidase n=1 Tax=Pontibacillus halophilus JSM 076056 = DSM 19796 TaxID=1385510 RepID=A0A0A5GEB8_9BACI|nr:alpha-glucosidase [Pontibacillus halophilus]KGX91551.1 oligo-1,6-glucosidase [Pontibacillus halophilus JSM 076056 = DSM 19796]